MTTPATPPNDSTAYVTSSGTPVRDFYLWVRSVADWFSGKNGAWKAYTPVVSADSGTLGAGVTAQGFFYQIGKLVFVTIEISIPNNGTGAGAIDFTLPPINANLRGLTRPFPGVGVAGSTEILVTYLTSTTTAKTRFYDSTYPGNATPLDVSFVYEAA